MRRLPWIARAALRTVPHSRRADVEGDLTEVHARRRSARGRALAWVLTALESLLVAGAFLAMRRGPRSGGRWVSGTEVRLALRMMRRRPGLSLTAVFALAVGIGLATTGFTLLDGILFGEVPVAGGDRLYAVDLRDADRSGAPVPPSAFQTLGSGTPVLELIGAHRSVQLNLLDAQGSPTPVRAAWVTPSTMELMGGGAVVGRPLLTEDARPGAPLVVALGESIWRARWGADPSVIGAPLQIGDRMATIVGVLPGTFVFPGNQDLWLPLDDATLGGTSLGAHPGVDLFAVLTEGAEVESATARVQAAVDGAPRAASADGRVEVRLIPYARAGMSEGADIFLTGIVLALILVLLVAAANVANLVFAKTSERQSELAVRTALGARRSRLVGQVFVEVLVLGVIAAGIGLVASQAALGWLGATLDEVPPWVSFSPDVRVILFVTFLAVMSSAVAGALPALRVTRASARDTLSASGRSGGLSFSRFSTAMIVAEVALSVAFLTGAAVMARGFAGYLVPNPHLPAGEVLTARIYYEPPPIPAAGREVSQDWQFDSIRARYDGTTDAVRALPGVVSSAFATTLPRGEPRSSRVIAEGLASEPEPIDGTVRLVQVSDGFFETLGVRPSLGASFGPEAVETEGVREAVVNEPFAERFFPGRNPIGRRFRFVQPGEDEAVEPVWHRVAGVVPDLGMSPGDPSQAAGVYLPLGTSNYFHVLLRPVGGDPMALVEPLRRAVASVDQRIRVDDVMMLERSGWEGRALLQGLASAMSIMGAMALFLSLIGLNAIMAFSITRRTREIGVRVALGAGPGQVLSDVMRRSVMQLCLGAAAGVGLSILLLQVTTVLPIRIDPGGPWLIPALATVMVVTGLLASWVPARRALRIDPMDALRSD